MLAMGPAQDRPEPGTGPAVSDARFGHQVLGRFWTCPVRKLSGFRTGPVRELISCFRMAGLVDGANVPPLPASANIGVFKSLSNDVRMPRHAISDSIKLLPERRHAVTRRWAGLVLLLSVTW